jgi:hypothetical protein
MKNLKLRDQEHDEKFQKLFKKILLKHFFTKELFCIFAKKIENEL